MFTSVTRSEDLVGNTASWFGSTPKRWRVLPARALFEESKRAGHEDEALLSVTIGRGVVTQSEFLSESAKKDSSNLDKSRYKLVEPGDIVYNKMRAWQGALGMSLRRGIVSPAYVVMRPKSEPGRFLELLMRTPAFAKEAERLSYGITSDMWSLRPEHFKMINFPIAPADEQAAIVKYLGHAHARIDRAIAAKSNLIGLLEEQRQAIIHEAVTRGLDASVPLKDSGIPWLGEIPAHWATSRLKTLISAGPTNGTSPQISEDGELETFSLSAVRHGVLDVRPGDIKFVSASAVPRQDDYRLRVGDVLLVRGNGNINLVGRAAEVLEDRPHGIYPDLLIRVRPNAVTDPRFLTMLINSRVVRQQIEVAARTAVGTFKISGDVVKNLMLVHPGLSEQVAIVRECDSRTTSIRGSIDIARREIELLREFRTRLTSDVVTGQADVREIAATLPELGDEGFAGAYSEIDEDESVDSELELVGAGD